MQFRIIALGTALLLSSVLLRILVSLPFAQQLVGDLVAAQQSSIASYVAGDIGHSITERRALLATLATTMPPALISDPAKLGDWIADRQTLNPLFDTALLVLRPNGHGLLAQYPVIAARDQLDFSHFDWFQAALVSDGAVIGKPQHGRLSGEPVLMMAVAIRDADKQLKAILVGVTALNAPGFLNRLQANRLGAGGGFLLVSPTDKLFVAASDPSMILKPTPPVGVNLLHDRAMAGFRGSGATINADGVEEMSTMVSVPGTSWFVVARIPLSEAYAPITQTRNSGLMSAAGLLIVMLLAVLIGLPRILRPLTDAARAMREMADGKRPLAPLRIKRADEVGDLVTGFNYLVARLTEKERALKASETQLKYMAHHDALTGLYNRFMLEDRLQQAVARAERDGSHFALLFCDLDDFKPVNDEHGHETGDAILRQAAARLTDGRRQTDTVARLGGDEFVVLLTDLDNGRDTALGVAEQLLKSINQPFLVGDKIVRLGASIGIALHRPGGLSISKIMSQADIAMYHAKRGGKNGIKLFELAMAP